MRKDPSEFRARFQRWKNGEPVYAGGKSLPAYKDGRDDYWALFAKAQELTADPREQYDYVGYFNKYGTIKPLDEPIPPFRKSNGHYPDEFKLPGHPTFSNESIYSNDRLPGGHWYGNSLFDHSDFTFQHSDETLDYLRWADPGVISTYLGGIVLPSINVYAKRTIIPKY